MHKVKPASPLVSCRLETQAQRSGGGGIIQDYAYTLLKNISKLACSPYRNINV